MPFRFASSVSVSTEFEPLQAESEIILKVVSDGVMSGSAENKGAAEIGTATSFFAKVRSAQDGRRFRVRTQRSVGFHGGPHRQCAG